MGFSTINIHCNLISGVKNNDNSTDILYTFTLTEPPGYLINIIPRLRLGHRYRLSHGHSHTHRLTLRLIFILNYKYY